MSHRKPADQRTGRGGTVDLVPDADVVVLEAPAPDRAWLAGTKRDWAALWSDDLTDHYRVTDEPGARRLFGWRDELARTIAAAKDARKEAAKEPVVKGSKGQPVTSPFYDVADKLDARALAIETRVLALEDRLGLNPHARLKLGLTEMKGRSLAVQNAAMLAALEGVANGTPDPRAPSGNPAELPA